jgi:indolepyruvate decarboxylase
MRSSSVVDITAFETGDFAPFDVSAGWDYRALATGVRRTRLPRRDRAELRTVMSEINELSGVPALVEVVIPKNDLAPQPERLTAPPGDAQPTGRTM